MASLIENLISILDAENQEYEILLELSKKKTPVLVKGDLDALREIVEQEQFYADKVANLEKMRMEVVTDIATVLNKEVNTLTVRTIIGLLKGQDKEQKELSQVHDKLKRTLKDMVVINDRNKELIQNSLEMVQFEINLINSAKQIPETANYTKDAYSAGSVVPQRTGGFDTKQ